MKKTRSRTRGSRAEQAMFGRVRRIHLVGIGGTGMCGIAEVLLSLGFSVTGSDLGSTDVTDRLKAAGARIAHDHRSPLVLDADVVVVSTAIEKGNPEVLAARGRSIPVIRRAEMLAELMRMKRGIAVGGSHGKTTVTSMAAGVLIEGGLDPTVVVGGRVKRLGTNARVGAGDTMVAEADESDGTFLRLQPTIAIITNIDREHVDFYASLEDTFDAFVHFANGVPFYGAVVLCLDDANTQAVVPRIERRIVTYGLDPGADLMAREVQPIRGGSRFELVWHGESLGSCRLAVPGRHNIANALAAATLGLELGIEASDIVRGLEGFDGVGRRLERRGECGGVVVYDDYAHHPREIEATLKALREQWTGRIVAVFQPHRFSRAEVLADEFGRSFYGADTVVVAPIYPAGEQPIPGIDASMLADRCRSYGHKDVHVAADLDSLAEQLAEQVSSGDLVITLGAGTVWRVGEALLSRLRGHEADSLKLAPDPIEAPAIVASGGASAIDLVADLEGEVKTAHRMARCTSFRLGGPAELVFVPSSAAAAAEAIARAIEAGGDVTALGGGTHLLVADRGVAGIVLSPGPAFSEIRIDNDGRVHCGAAAPLAKVMRKTIAEGWVGMETLAGIPGSLGGAVVMNAGTRDGDIGDLIAAVRGVDRTGRLIRVAGKDLDFAYRKSQVSELGLILLEIELTLEQGDAESASKRAEEIRVYRNRTQPHKVRSAGSVFKNPPGESAGRLLDRSGLKGTSVGGARVSEVHANFLIAEKGCATNDLANLIEQCRQAVWERHRIGLELEIRPIGFDPDELPLIWSSE